MIHAITNGWYKKAYLKVWYFKVSTYREIYDFLANGDCLEILQWGKIFIKN